MSNERLQTKLIYKTKKGSLLLQDNQILFHFPND